VHTVMQHFIGSVFNLPTFRQNSKHMSTLWIKRY